MDEARGTLAPSPAPIQDCHPLCLGSRAVTASVLGGLAWAVPSERGDQWSHVTSFPGWLHTVHGGPVWGGGGHTLPFGSYRSGEQAWECRASAVRPFPRARTLRAGDSWLHTPPSISSFLMKRLVLPALLQVTVLVHSVWPRRRRPLGPGCLPRAGGAGPGGAAQAEGTPGFVAEPVICSDLLPDKWPTPAPPPPRSSTTSGRLGSYSNISRNLCRLRWTAAERLKALGARPRP